MKENFEIPENGLTPEYWNGHDLNDVCEWSKKPWTLSREETQALRVERNQLKGLVRSILEVYKGETSEQTVRRFNVGDLFDGASFAPGTVVRLETERVSRYKIFGQWTQPLYVCKTNLGVVCPSNYSSSNNGRILMTVGENAFLNDPGRIVMLTTPSIITVGEVEHERTLPEFGGTLWEKIERVNWTEVLKRGLGMPELVPESQRASLLPQSQHKQS